jgi:hypothetical protein
MNTLTIKLDETQLRDLKVFLERVELRGTEAIRFVSLVKSIGAAQIDDSIKNKVDTEVIAKNT